MNSSDTMEHILDVLYSAMVVSDRVSLPVQMIDALSADAFSVNRIPIVEWIRSVTASPSPEVRDCAVQIFNTYVAIVHHKSDPHILENKRTLAFAAAAAVSMSSKFFQSTNPQGPSQFESFNVEDLIYFERKMLMTVSGLISPRNSPSFFLTYFMYFFEELNSRGVQNVDVAKLSQRAAMLIGEFWEDSRSMRFAPSTIALASIVVAMSVQKQGSCKPFLNQLPNYFFQSVDGRDSSLPFAYKMDYLDCHACVGCMERLPSLRPKQSTASPVCVGDCEILA